MEMDHDIIVSNKVENIEEMIFWLHPGATDAEACSKGSSLCEVFRHCNHCRNIPVAFCG